MTRPFQFEGTRRRDQAEAGIAALSEAVATLNTAKSKLSAQQAQLTVQEKQAQGAVTAEKSALAANQLVEQQQSAALG